MDERERDRGIGIFMSELNFQCVLSLELMIKVEKGFSYLSNSNEPRYFIVRRIELLDDDESPHLPSIHTSTINIYANITRSSSER